jgi:hypothetical protein
MNGLSKKAEALWEEQIHEWPMLSEGLATLQTCEYRPVLIGGIRMELQWNPGRIGSVSAKVDPESIAARPCFLCPGSLPMEQRAIPLEGDWHILCNPRPILAPHFTVPTLRHQPQSIEAGISTMLNLAREMGEDYVLFYNGPQCGASAPDHMHLQAVPRNQTPLIDQLDLPDSASTEPNIEWAFRGHIPFGISREPFLPLALWFGDSADSLVENIRHAIHILARIHPQPNGNEPLLNAFSWYRSGNWLFGIFPRAKHRPACYGTGTGQILLSPGTLDLLGRIVTPRHQDYQYLEDQRVEEILKEVCLPGNQFQEWYRLFA